MSEAVPTRPCSRESAAVILLGVLGTNPIFAYVDVSIIPYGHLASPDLNGSGQVHVTTL